MNLSLDINADLGEGGLYDEALMPLISSANISCGKHAGDTTSILKALALAKHYKVSVGAHPGYDDRLNYGRKELSLSKDAIYQLILNQLTEFSKLAKENEVELVHVKPHGALYNQSARDPEIAQTLARAVYDFNSKLILFGLSGSESIKQALNVGLKVKEEMFADRSYQVDGTLTPRTQPNAIIEDSEAAAAQVLSVIRTHTLKTTSGTHLTLKADTVCVHGDNPHGVQIAQALVSALKSAHIQIKA